MTLRPFDRMLTATRGETTATYTYWPDGTRRYDDNRQRDHGRV